MEFQEELNALSNDGKMFYHGGLKRIIKVKMGKLLFCVDQPERTSILQVGDHNGTFSTFWGHSCNVDGYCKDNHVQSCKNVGSTVYTRLFLANTMDLMRQICCLPVREQSILMQKAIQETMLYNHAMEENVHHGMSFILHLHFVQQQTIQPTMIIS